MPSSKAALCNSGRTEGPIWFNLLFQQSILNPSPRKWINDEAVIHFHMVGRQTHAQKIKGGSLNIFSATMINPSDASFYSSQGNSHYKLRYQVNI